jgi:hypothetical protein
MLRRVAGYVAGLYLLFAVIGRFVEGMGAVRRGCASDCWCHHPVLSTFRWVFPLVTISTQTADTTFKLPNDQAGRTVLRCEQPAEAADDHYESRETTS